MQLPRLRAQELLLHRADGQQAPRLLAAEIIMFDDVVVVYKFIGDLMFYVTGHQDENEVILFNVLTAFCDSVTLLLRCGHHALGLFDGRQNLRLAA
jgi:hypothetical protein